MINLKERFNQLTPGGKKGLVWALIGIGILTIAITGYNSRSTRIESIAKESGKNIQLDPDLIDKTMLKEQRREIDDLKKNVEELQKGISPKTGAHIVTPKKQSQAQTTEVPDTQALPPIPDPNEIENKTVIQPPPLSPDKMGPPPQGGVIPSRRGNQQAEKKIVGKIAVITNQGATPKDDGKKKGRTVYLPPSFMEASLLTGFDAATSGAGKSSPEPLLLRIQTPAVLPNDIKANLAGCFVIGEAVGRLDKERADVRLVSLSCLSNEGRAVIDTPVKGFVTDSDSKVGLSGRVVSRMGAATARSVIAGIFSGAGDALKAAATTTTTSPVYGATTSTIDSAQIGKYAIGGGLSEGANSLSDFYMTLAKQSTPVIEVGATKKITVIVSEGKELEIKENTRDEAL